jgi:hypothetical protein
MSQFLLFWSRELPRPTSRVVFSSLTSEHHVMTRAANDLFGADLQHVFVPTYDGRTVAELFDEAYNSVAAGAAFSTTAAGLLLNEVLRTGESLALWWSNDWSNLPRLTSETDLVAEVTRQLSEEPGEVYVAWKRAGNG